MFQLAKKGIVSLKATHIASNIELFQPVLLEIIRTNSSH